MAVQLGWRHSGNPGAANAHHINYGLEVGGDNTAIDNTGTGTDGRVKLVEVRGAQAAHRGSAESSSDRLIATFHGKFHRNASASAANRVTFQIEIGAGTVAAHWPEVQGYDPECIIGVDAFVVTFVNREFQIFLPFFLDARSEGRYLEIKAIAETGATSSATVIAQSQVLNIRIRRSNRRVRTTSQLGGSAMEYEGDLIGNCILHHEDFLIQGAFKNHSAAWPATLSASLIPLPWSGSTAMPFQNYSSGDMKIILFDDLADNLLPSASYLQTNVTGISNGATGRTNMQTRLKNQIQTTLNAIFTDAGFTNPNLWWQSDTQASTLVSQFTSRFSHSGGSWHLQNSTNFLSVPFWTYFAVYDSGISSVGIAEKHNVAQITTRGSRDYLLPYVSPIGSGNKDISDPIKIKAGYFLPRLTQTTGQSGGSVAKQYSSLNDFNTAVDAMADKVAITIAHEVAHSLGLMHEAKIGTSTPYRESGATPILSLMSSGIDSNAYGRDTKFSQQAKVLWHRAFGVTPTWTNTYLQNKTWGTDWATVDWSERKRRFYRLHQENSMSYVGLRSGSTPPPYAGTGASIQRGTYVP